MLWRTVSQVSAVFAFGCDMAAKKVYQEVPPRVGYALSEYGQSLSEVLDILCNWGERHVKKLISEGEEVEQNCNDNKNV